MEQDEKPIEEINENVNEAIEEVEQEDPPSMGGALKSFAFMALFLFGAYYFYSTMARYENGEEVTMMSILFAAYKLLGKTIPAIILGLIGLGAGFAGFNELKNANAAKGA